ncbi:MAG: hypothetical protein LVQ95_01375 [Candidatus Micrarchaeales archaeon]|nr:hypothetical protein [Candidatus Micrarchaeales archaeon]
MRYSIRINKKMRNIRVYAIVKKVQGNPNILTKLFMRIFAGRKKEEY